MRTIVVTLLLLACSKHEQHPGGRMGIHGMVLFGKTHHYLEHIPMFSPPHDVQAIFRVSGIDGDYSTGTFTVEPAQKFSLDDLLQRRLQEFTGTIYRGNFEDGGQKLHENVRITVDEVLLARDLPGSEPPPGKESFVIGEPGDTYVSAIITKARGVQKIVHGEQVLWCVVGPDFTNRCP